MSTVKGFTSTLKSILSTYLGISHNLPDLYNTLSRQGQTKVAQDTALQWLTLIAAGTIAAPYTGGTLFETKRILNITAHGLLPGQVLRFTSGPNNGVEIGVEEVLDVNYILVAGQLPFDPVAANTFNSYRYITPTVDAAGSVSPPVSVNMGFLLDAVQTPVSEDTTNLLASVGLPVSQIPSRAYASDSIDTSTLGAVPSDTQVVPARGNKKLKVVNNSGVVVDLYIGAAIVALIAPGESGTFDFGANPAEVIGFGSASPAAGALYVTYFN